MGLGTTAVANFYRQSDGVATYKHVPMVLAQAEIELFSQCWKSLKEPPDWMPPTMRRTALTSAIFSLVLRAIHNWSRPSSEDTSSGRRREIVRAVRQHIETHLEEADDLDTLAHLSGYSKFHFSRMFKECAGQTVHEFVNSCRVKRATKLIQDGVQRKLIAGELGFSCPAAFSNWQRKNRVLIGKAE